MNGRWYVWNRDCSYSVVTNIIARFFHLTACLSRQLTFKIKFDFKRSLEIFLTLHLYCEVSSQLTKLRLNWSFKTTISWMQFNVSMFFFKKTELTRKLCNVKWIRNLFWHANCIQINNWNLKPNRKTKISAPNKTKGQLISEWLFDVLNFPKKLV